MCDAEKTIADNITAMMVEYLPLRRDSTSRIIHLRKNNSSAKA